MKITRLLALLLLLQLPLASYMHADECGNVERIIEISNFTGSIIFAGLAFLAYKIKAGPAKAYVKNGSTEAEAAKQVEGDIFLKKVFTGLSLFLSAFCLYEGLNTCGDIGGLYEILK